MHSFYQSLSFAVTHCKFLSLFVIFCHYLSLVVICYHSSYHWLSLVVIRCTNQCYLLFFVSIRCYSLYHLLSFVAMRCTTYLSFYKRSMKISNQSIMRLVNKLFETKQNLLIFKHIIVFFLRHSSYYPCSTEKVLCLTRFFCNWENAINGTPKL